MTGSPCPNPGCGATERRASVWGGTLCVRCYPAMGRYTPGAGHYDGYAEPAHCRRTAPPPPTAAPTHTARKKRTAEDPEDMVRLW